MPADFIVVVRDSGVDSSPPQMIVPLGGSNIVGLIGPRNLRLVANNPGIQIKEIDPRKIISDPELNLRIDQKTGETPGSIARVFRMVNTVMALPAETRLFRISGKARLGKNGAIVRAMRPGSPKWEASLYVTVLGQRRVRLAIRPVQVRDQHGNIGYHSKLPLNAEQLCADMNAIWTPQANIVFELVSSRVAIPTEAAIQKATYGAKTLPRQLDPNAVAPVFKALLSPDADFTIFRVESVWPDGWPKPPLAMTFAKDRFALVGDNGLIATREIDLVTKMPKINIRRVMPHEAGHWLGDPEEKWDAHRGVTDPGLLMCLGGYGLKIPVAETLQYFNTNY